MSTSFGAVIPVTGLNLGFLGQVSRTGERVIVVGQAYSGTSNANNIPFGAPVVIVPDSSAQGGSTTSPSSPPPLTTSLGGTFQQLSDYIAASTLPAPVANTAYQIAGIAVREVKTTLGYPVTPGTLPIGYYAPGDVMEILERGSIVVSITAGTPQRNAQVYLRLTANATYSRGAAGALEAKATDYATNQCPLTGIVFRTGYVDGVGQAEITLLERLAA
jgi:hypothetical protein